MEKEAELSLDKVYDLPVFTILEAGERYVAVAEKMAKWLVLENEVQLDSLHMLEQKAAIQSVLEKYPDHEEDVVWVLTQLEAKNIEHTSPVSIFENTKLHLHMTNRCNLHCPHCYMESGMAYENELTTEEIKSLCAEFKRVGGTHVSLTGGEPTVRPDFLELAEYISGLGMKLSIYSNGVLWDEAKVKRISELNIDGVQISLDGYDEPTNATVRGPGVFDRALHAIDLFERYGVLVKVAVTAPYELMLEHPEEYVRLSRQLIGQYGAEKLELNYSYFFMPGRELDPEKIRAFKDIYFQKVDEVVRQVYGDVTEENFVDNLLDDCIFDSCGYGGLNVLPDGSFYFCDRIPDVRCAGNIREMSFDRVWELAKKAEEAGKIDHFEPCGHCPLRYICGGGCRVEFFRDFTQTEDIEQVDPAKIRPRICKKEDFDKIVALMVKTNERFFC